MVPPLLVGGSSTKGRRPSRGLTMALAIPGKSALQERGIPDCILGYLIIAQNSYCRTPCFIRRYHPVLCNYVFLGVAKSFPQASGGEFCYRRMSEFFTLWLSPSNISRWLWCTSRSMIAVVIASSRKMFTHLLNSRFVVRIMLRFS